MNKSQDKNSSDALNNSDFEISRSSSQIEGSVSRIQELEAEQNQLSESLLSLSTKFAQVQFRIQQIAFAPSEQREEMIQRLQEFASRSCTNIQQFRKQQSNEASNLPLIIKENHEDDTNSSEQMRYLIEELRLQLGELEQFAWKNGHLKGDLPLSELRARQTLILERLREKMHLQVKLVGPDAATDTNEFHKKLDADLDEAERGLREKDQIVLHLSTQIADLERYIFLLQQEAGTVSDSDIQNTSQHESNFDKHGKGKATTNNGWLARYIWPRTTRHFERNELKRSTLCNHYGDQRAELELAVDEVVNLMRKHQILSVNREERADLSVDELNKLVMDCGQEVILVSIRKRLCPALRALLEHGLQPSIVTASNGIHIFSSGISLLANHMKKNKSDRTIKGELKAEGRKLEHIWDVIVFFSRSEQSC